MIIQHASTHLHTHTPLYRYLYIQYICLRYMQSGPPSSFLSLGKKMSSKRARLVVWGRIISRIGDANLLFEVSFPLFTVWCTYVMVNHSVLPAGPLRFMTSCESPANFQKLTKASFSPVLLFFITQLGGTTELLKPPHCLSGTTY